ncbi:hypothetical protein PCASD_24762 [Puccinia coronata f. sp. avenae]|uniref:Secreted protein n=1 Tax=Puccinia coronata f. sp. avenae TaxID=200324 RepID=A0A2N5S7A4_9BASI|nr:hypothetical protein PCASD_24762 [Puccinia coronata f. sp. avenae]
MRFEVQVLSLISLLVVVYTRAGLAVDPSLTRTSPTASTSQTNLQTASTAPGSKLQARVDNCRPIPGLLPLPADKSLSLTIDLNPESLRPINRTSGANPAFRINIIQLHRPKPVTRIRGSQLIESDSKHVKIWAR